MLLYLIQAHERPQQVEALCRRISHPSCRIIVLIDSAGSITEQDVIGLRERLAGCSVSLKFVPPVTWGGFSQTWAWLEALLYSVRAVPDWQWVINLSGACLPLRLTSDLLDVLAEDAREGVRIRLHQFGDNGFEINDKSQIPSLIGREPHEFVADTPTRYERQMLAYRLDAHIENLAADDEVIRELLLGWPIRGSLTFQDFAAAKQFLIRRLTPCEMEMRRIFLQKYSLRGGRVWFALQRNVVTELVADPVAYEIADGLRSFFCSDELFLQTYFHHKGDVRSGWLRYKNFHFDYGAPHNIDCTYIDKLITSDAFFARKVDYLSCPQLIQHFGVGEK